ncbi:MAG: hypothetical protein P1P64_06740 [Treponemataceae bacterium]
MENYKCLSCGAPIVFKPDVGGFKCDYCFSTFTEAELTAAVQKKSSKSSDSDGDGVKGYTCGNCGAAVVVGDTSNTAFCYYCHSPIVISDRLQGAFKPDVIIPFKLDKKAALAKFLTWAKKHKYTPKDFTSNMQQEKMTGIYLPYWQADFLANVDYSAIGVSSRSWISGDKEYTETTKVAIDRSGSIDVNSVEQLAFSKVNENLINAISNFDDTEQRPFSPGYLAGFFSEQYDIAKETAEENLRFRAKQEVESQISASHNFATIRNEENKTTYKTKKVSYALFPSWILSYVYNGKSYIFAVNGQTGEIAGEAPLSTKKMVIRSVIRALIVATALILGGLFIW